MDLVFSRLDDSVARFTIHGATPAFANALRRSMIGEVPTLAIEDIRIYDNTSVLFDEILAHRLGMIPIKTDLSQYSPRADCSCGGVGCPGCTVTFTLSAEGPKMVTSGDLISMDPKATPVLDNIPIIKLWEGQKSTTVKNTQSGNRLSHAATRSSRLLLSPRTATAAENAFPSVRATFWKLPTAKYPSVL